MSLLDIINKIVELASIGKYYQKNGFPTVRYTRSEKIISFIGDNEGESYDAVSTAYHMDKDIEFTYTHEKYRSILMDFFFDSIHDRKKVNEDDIAVFKNFLTQKPIKTYSVFREIRGIILNNPGEKLHIGPFTIYHFQSKRKEIESESSSKGFDFYWHREAPKYLIKIDEKARHCEKAIEIADQHFEKFELILKFIIGRKINKYEVGIFNFTAKHIWAVTISDEGPGYSAKRVGSIVELPLDDPYFTNTNKTGLNKIWEVSFISNPTKMQKRLALAAEWIGQSIAEHSPQSAFLKAAIALEIVFTYNEKAIITPSILNQISESAALILGKTVESRIEIDKEVRRLYGLRSAIVHYGSKDILDSDYDSILIIARSLVIRFLCLDSLGNLKTPEDLHSFLKKIRYSCDTIKDR